MVLLFSKRCFINGSLCAECTIAMIVCRKCFASWLMLTNIIVFKWSIVKEALVLVTKATSCILILTKFH